MKVILPLLSSERIQMPLEVSGLAKLYFRQTKSNLNAQSLPFQLPARITS